MSHIQIDFFKTSLVLRSNQNSEFVTVRKYNPSLEKVAYISIRNRLMKNKHQNLTAAHEALAVLSPFAFLNWISLSGGSHHQTYVKTKP